MTIGEVVWSVRLRMKKLAEETYKSRISRVFAKRKRPVSD
jgi:hypothetical protein